MIRLPRIFGFMLDLLHQVTWKRYIAYIATLENVEVFNYGNCMFYFEKKHAVSIKDAVEYLEVNCPEIADSIKTGYGLSFFIKGDYTANKRISNLKFFINENTASYGMDGIVIAIGFGVQLNMDAKRRGFNKFRIFPQHKRVYVKAWLDWLKDQKINRELIEYNLENNNYQAL